MKLTRRQYLKWMGAAGASLSLPLLSAWRAAAAETAAIVPSLKAAASARGIHYGTGLETAAIMPLTPDFSQALLRHCELIAPVLAWRWIDNGGPGKYDYSEKKSAIDFFTSKGLRLSGYHLVWHFATPDWFVDLHDRKVAEKALRGHIAYMAKTFGHISYSWNPVNEALNAWDRRADGLRDTKYLQLFGLDYFRIAFEAAKETAPKVLRLYNEHGMETVDEESLSKRKAFLNLIDRLLAQNVPIDGVGLQSHLDTSRFKFDETSYRNFLGEIASRGLKIFISELDVADARAAGSITERDRMVADVYSRYLAATLDEKAVKAVLTWGLTDRFTWIVPHFKPSFARSDGMPTRPLLFDENYAAKPAYYAVLNAFRNAPKRD